MNTQVNRNVIDSALQHRAKNNNLITEPDSSKSPLIAKRQQESLMEARNQYGNSHLSNGSTVISPGRIKSPNANQIRKSMGGIVGNKGREIFPCSQEHSPDREDLTGAPMKYSTALPSK